MPARLPENAKHGRKPKPRAPAIALGGVEGLEDARDQLRLHPRTLILHFQDGPGTRGDGAALGWFRRFKIAACDGDMQLATFRHGIARIHRQVHQCLVNVARVHARAGAWAFKIKRDRNTTAQKPGQQWRHAIHGAVECDHARLHRLAAGKGQKLAHQPGTAPGAIQYLA